MEFGSDDQKLIEPILSSHQQSEDVGHLQNDRRQTGLAWVKDFDPSTGEEVVVNLPSFFKGASGGIILPPYGPDVSSSPLESRLNVLGRFPSPLLEPFSFPIYLLGSSVLKFSFRHHLFILPSFNSLWGVRRALFTRFGLVLMITVRLGWSITEMDADCSSEDWQTENTVQLYSAIIFVTLLALWVEYQLKNWPEPPGFLAYLRSLSPPKCEEFFFSYTWAVRATDVRTLARALWNSGVGVWIDILKLCSGDSIGTSIRTMIKKSYLTVVFLNPKYLKSRNCCIEAYEASLKADADPDSVIVCRIHDPSDPEQLPPEAIKYWEDKNVRVVTGFLALMQELDQEVKQANFRKYNWWKSNQSEQLSSGIPQHIVLPDCVPLFWAGFFPIFRFVLPPSSVSLGPYWLSGNCKQTGRQTRVSVLLFVTLLSLLGTGASLALFGMEAWHHDQLGFIFIVLLSITNCVPILETSKIFDTRIEMSDCLRPLTSTTFVTKDANSPIRPVQVIIEGNTNHVIAKNLKRFLKRIGHLFEHDEKNDPQRMDHHLHSPIQDPSSTPEKSRRLSALFSSSPPPSPSPGRRARDSFMKIERQGQPVITIFILATLDERNKWYKKRNKIDFSRAIFIWAGPEDEEFGPFAVGGSDEARSWFSDRLVLLAGREGERLASEIFSSLGIRVASALYKIPTTDFSSTTPVTEPNYDDQTTSQTTTNNPS
eukprot:TRINITY_DN3958_c0_g1_i1.p1 TRINITY_DN3958_c0_g1~~TRINITY_DN3958_c0_g1_i1.p1  ORF type:complete len:723 (+),score=157.77 TRINITY_DN3958_c0_g1_i1:41-2170(+)